MIPIVSLHTGRAQQHESPKHNYATIFPLFCILFFFIFVPFPWLKLLSNGQHRDRKEFGIRLKPVALFANLRAASSVLVRWPISWPSDRGSLTVAIKTHTRRCTHTHACREIAHTLTNTCAHVCAHMQCSAASDCPSLSAFFFFREACLDLTSHLLLTIRQTHTHVHTHMPLHFPCQKTLCSLTSFNPLPPPPVLLPSSSSSLPPPKHILLHPLPFRSI